MIAENQMTDEARQIEEEIEDLRQEMEKFKREKERVRAIVGRIGGMPTFNTKIINIALVVFILTCLVVSLVTGDTLRFVMLELALAALSLKIIYLVHHQGRISHFQLWILSSLEWRLDEVLRELRELSKSPPIGKKDAEA